MRVIIAGSRTITDYNLVCHAIAQSGIADQITCVISGTAGGVDTLGERWAKDHGILIERHPADWNRHGKRAGFIRNSEMAQVADALIAVTTGSNGTAHMIQAACARGIPVYVLDTRRHRKAITPYE